MSKQEYITLKKLCTSYKVEMAFFDQLSEYGLIEIVKLERTRVIHLDRVRDLERMIRLHHELNINLEGIDAVFNLLNRIDDLENELQATRNRLKIYEENFH